MSERNEKALEFLLTRRSRPAKSLVAPGPDRAALTEILTAAARTPDHGKLEPWRFIVLDKPAMERLAQLSEIRGQAIGIAPDKIAKIGYVFKHSPMAVVVVSSPKPSPKVPDIEQIYSAGAVCLSLVNGALAAGWGANWLSGWVCYDRDFLTEGLDLDVSEEVAGIIHIGTQTSAPPERPRPDLAELITWMDE